MQTHSPTAAEGVELPLHTSQIPAPLHDKAVGGGGLDVEVSPHHHGNEGVQQDQEHHQHEGDVEDDTQGSGGGGKWRRDLRSVGVWQG